MDEMVKKLPLGCGNTVVALWASVALMIPSIAWAAGSCEIWVARVVSVQGTLEARGAGEARWASVALGETFCPGDAIRTLERSRAAIVLSNEATLRLDQNTTVTFSEEKEEQATLLELLKGAVHFFSRRPRSLRVLTPYVNAAVEGTEFIVRVERDQTLLTVLEGQIAATNPAGRLILARNESAVAQAGRAPVLRTVVRPRDAVQWALYYPPILDVRALNLSEDEDRWGSLVRSSYGAYRKGDLAWAFSVLEGASDNVQDPRFFTYRSQLYLTVGRIDDARSDIEMALHLDPGNSPAFALQSIIAVVQNQKQEALDLASKAVELDPESSTARIALSYAQQAHFDLEAALKSLREAVKLDPEDALAWARLAEIWLAHGYLGEAAKAAREAAALNPDHARTQTVLGFSFLTRMKTEDAKRAFERAIELDQADALPRLGLGLAKIREGELKAGRAEIEIAVSLDPNSSLIRSYLGKAYFEEKRDVRAESQYLVARELDPMDPTPWFYDAIRKQTENRPVEALHDLQRSIELNDNRAVYRSRLLLDEDLAARSASLGRIYSDLGFVHLGLVEASKSLSLDPTNYSAHRFLSDTYPRLPRHEIARKSELLQAQLMQPVNVNPIQPSLALTDLNIAAGGGPAEATFNEFSPLFERNKIQLVASGMLGNNETLGDEVVLSGLHEFISFSAGQFHVDTEGFRPNNDFKHDVIDVFAQASLSPSVNLQAEYLYREKDQGDLDLNFDPNDFSPEDRREVDQEVIRFGGRLSVGPRSSVLLSAVHSDQDGGTRNVEVNTDLGFPLTIEVFEETHERGNQVEGRYILASNRFDMNLGAGHYYADSDEEETASCTSPFGPVPCEPSPPTDYSRRYTNVYLYTGLALWPSVRATVGLSYDALDQRDLDKNEFSPKFGLEWDITDYARLRAAAFKTIKRALVFDQTIEPTQIAGFNQFFDDPNGTESERYGVGLDVRLAENLLAGGEASLRRLDVPIQGNEDLIFEAQDEDLYHAYVYWTLFSGLAVSTELYFEHFECTDAGDVNEPDHVKTLYVPLSFRYFWPSGFFVQLSPVYVHQSVDRPASSTLEDGEDDFVLVNASAGFRLPKRRGIISIEAKNLFDKDFDFQDDNFRKSTPTNPQFIPEQSIVGRITLNF
jgi:tetratricopeptide (TPR) repeat protein